MTTTVVESRNVAAERMLDATETLVEALRDLGHTQETAWDYVVALADKAGLNHPTRPFRKALFDLVWNGNVALFRTAVALIDNSRILGRSREDAWLMMVGAKNVGHAPEAIFNMLWPEEN